MQACHDFHFTVQPDDAAARAGGLSHGQLRRHGQTVLPRVTGHVLVGQWRCQAGHLLMLTQDSPYHEELHILYLDSTAQLRDELSISFLSPQGIGLLSDVAPAPEEDRIDFDFYGRWSLQVHAAPQRGWGTALPAGVKRTWSRWLAPHCLSITQVR